MVNHTNPISGWETIVVTLQYRQYARTHKVHLNLPHLEGQSFACPLPPPLQISTWDRLDFKQPHLVNQSQVKTDCKHCHGSYLSSLLPLLVHAVTLEKTLCCCSFCQPCPPWLKAADPHQPIEALLQQSQWSWGSWIVLSTRCLRAFEVNLAIQAQGSTCHTSKQGNLMESVLVPSQLLLTSRCTFILYSYSAWFLFCSCPCPQQLH